MPYQNTTRLKLTESFTEFEDIFIVETACLWKFVRLPAVLAQKFARKKPLAQLAKDTVLCRKGTIMVINFILYTL